MHHDGVHADELQQHHVVGKAAFELLFRHRIAAVLDDDGLAVEAPDIGQGFGKNLRFDGSADRVAGHLG